MARTILGVGDLAGLHRRADLCDCHWLAAMQRCREELNGRFAEFAAVYDRFAAEIGRQILPDETKLQYQRPPTFRVHLVGAKTASAPHRDRSYARGRRFVNAWVPLVEVSGTNTLWVDQAGDGQLAPVNLRYGEVLVFNGYDLLHGSVENTSDTTRVSFDMRFYTAR